MIVLAIAGVYLRRLARDRTALFFVVVLPVLVILVVGASVGGFNHFKVGLVDDSNGPLTRGLVADLRHDGAFKITTYRSTGSLKTAVRRQEVSAGIVVPASAEAHLRAGDTVTIPVIGQQVNTNTQAAFSAISSAVAAHGGVVQAASFTTKEVGSTFDQNLARANATVSKVPSVAVRSTRVDTRRRFLPDGYSYSAPTMLVLFVFINSLALGAIAIENRRQGLYQRFLAGPVRPRTIVLGEVAGAFSIAIVQSILIIAFGAFVFGVHWGDPVGAAVLVVTWALVGTGAGMLSGSLFRTPEQATAIGPVTGIALGMLGGCMWPLAIVGPAMRTIGHFVPHAWAVDAWVELLSRGGGVRDITRELIVLIAFAVGLIALASTRLRHTLTQ